MTDNQDKVNIEVVSIDDLIQDDHNFNRGTEQGAQLIERSFRECGAGRSVFIDKDNRLVGGNKAQKGFKAAGKRKVIIVDSDADTLVAVRRKDVSLDSEEGRKMAYLDNLTTQVNLEWDSEQIDTVQAEMPGFDLEDYTPDWVLEQIRAEEETAAAADERDNAEKPERQRDPDSEIIVATVSLFGTTEDMMMHQALTKDEADKLIKLAKQEGAGNLMKRIIEAL
jgi:hypothetical protein